MQPSTDNPNTALSKIYGAIEHLIKHTDPYFLVKRLTDFHEKNGIVYKLEITKPNSDIDDTKYSSQFSLTARKSNDSQVKVYPYIGDMIAGFYFPSKEFNAGEKVELHYGSCDPDVDIPNRDDNNKFVYTFEIDGQPKIYKPIDNRYYYNLLCSQYSNVILSNPECKTVYILYVNLTANLRRFIAQASTMHSISNGLFVRYQAGICRIVNSNDDFYQKFKNVCLYEWTYPYDHYSNVIKKWLRRQRDNRSEITTIDELNEMYPNHTLYIEI